MISTRERLKEGSSRPQSLIQQECQVRPMLSQIGFLLTIGLSATGISETRTDSKGLTMRVSGTDHISKH